MDILDVASRIASSARVVALTGAGVSAESGLATFRDPGGLWERFDPAAPGGLLGAFIARPWDAIDFLRELQGALARARPNPGHLALAELERMGCLEAVITQNVDGLHREAGSRRVIELHGTLLRRRCSSCGRREEVSREELLDELQSMIDKLATYLVSHPAHLLRRCACGGLWRADVVEFGEPVQGLEEALAHCRGAEVMLVCGTSGEVYPACTLPAQARAAGALVVEVNPRETELSAEADVRLSGPAGEVLASLVAAVRRARAEAV